MLWPTMFCGAINKNTSASSFTSSAVTEPKLIWSAGAAGQSAGCAVCTQDVQARAALPVHCCQARHPESLLQVLPVQLPQSIWRRMRLTPLSDSGVP